MDEFLYAVFTFCSDTSLNGKLDTPEQLIANMKIVAVNINNELADIQ